MRVELRFDPLVFGEQAHALGSQLATHLLEKRAALRALEKSGR